mmetsp:Transcript_32282/g.45033  ORF Transcript_32282/g.45033 Transcript_32282/m.45033 type:complete len:359 (+) Transcript_32282:252-1328(+)
MFGPDPAELIALPQADVKILPISNVTVEELARLLVQRVADGYHDDLRSMGVRSFSIRVTSGPGQGAIVSQELFATDEDGDEYLREKLPKCYENMELGDNRGGVGACEKAKEGYSEERERSISPPIAVVTGASSGIGLETAKVFLEAGYEVVNISRSACPLSSVRNLSCDLADIASVALTANTDLERMISMGNKHRKRNVCLVHNAAMFFGDTAVETNAGNFRDSLLVQTVSPSIINRSLIPRMAPGSSIIFIGSTLSEKAVEGTLSYSTSKHAVVGLMRATTQDLFGTGIHTSLLCPGFTDTPMLQKHLGDDVESLARNNAYGRLVKPEEIAKLVLTTAHSPALNGSVLHANLGQHET